MYKNKEDGFNGIDGITVLPAQGEKDAILMVATALFDGEEYDSQVILEYTFDGKLMGKHYVKTGNTIFGIQNLTRDPDTGNYWFSTYGGRLPYQNKNFLFCASPDFELIAQYNLCTPIGLEALGNEKFYLSVGGGENGNRSGYAYEADLHYIESTVINGDEHRPPFFENLWDKTCGL